MINRGGGRHRARAVDNQGPDPAGRGGAAGEIPVVIIGFAAPRRLCQYIATDNYKGGVMGAQRLGELLGGKGKIFLIRCLEAPRAPTCAEKGFLETIQKEYPAMEFLTKDLYAGVTAESAYQTLENLLNRFPDVEGIFCPTITSFGTLRALESKGLAGKVKFVGFDSSQKLVDGCAGIHPRLGRSEPVHMGYLGVKAIVAYRKASLSRPRSTPAKRWSRRRTSTSPRSRLSYYPGRQDLPSAIINTTALFSVAKRLCREVSRGSRATEAIRGRRSGE